MVAGLAYGLVLISGFASPGLLNDSVFLYASNPNLYGDLKPHLISSAAVQPQGNVQGSNAGEFAFNVTVPAGSGYTFFLLIPTDIGGHIDSGTLTTLGSRPIAYVPDGSNGGHFGTLYKTTVRALR